MGGRSRNRCLAFRPVLKPRLAIPAAFVRGSSFGKFETATPVYEVAHNMSEPTRAKTDVIASIHHVLLLVSSRAPALRSLKAGAILSAYTSIRF